MKKDGVRVIKLSKDITVTMSRYRTMAEVTITCPNKKLDAAMELAQKELDLCPFMK